MSKIINLGSALGLKVSAVKVAEINQIVFKTSVNASQFGSTVTDNGKTYLVDVKANTADELTAKTVKKMAIDGYTAEVATMQQVAAIVVSEATGTVTEVTFENDGTGACRGGQSVAAFCKANGYKVSAVTVAVQNDVIFKTQGISTIPGLVKDNGLYYEIDVKANTATVIDSKALSDQAKADILEGKSSTATTFAESFGLITSLTLVKV